MTHRGRKLRTAGALVGVCLLLCGGAGAQGTARIPVQVIAGKLVVRCDVSTKERRIPVNLFLDYESTAGLELHNQAAAGLKAERDDGSGIPITVHLPGLALTVARRELGDDEWLDRYTKWYSKELGETAAVGTIGSKLLGNYHAVFDIGAGYVELSPKRERTGEPAEEVEGSTTLPITIQNRVAFVPVRYGEGEPGVFALGTSTYDTTIDPWTCDALGAPAGDVGPVRLGGTDVSEFVALRPEEVHYAHPDGAIGVTGINLLEHFRVEVDRVNRWVRFTQTAPAEFPEEDLAFFRARANEDSEELLAFLRDHGDTRLAYEAANLLVDWNLIYGATPEAMETAIGWVDETCIEDLKATGALELMERFAAFGEARWLVRAGEIGIEGGRNDRYPNAVHEIHAELGEVLLDELGEDRRAWEHLLSAAFGLPEDGYVNLNLGRYYEQAGRHTRAFSRYLQAAIRPESGPQAIVALERVQKELEGAEPFSVDLVERMIAGKVRNFGSATRFEPSEEHPASRTVLCEFYTNAHLGTGMAGAIGGALGNEGLQGHFDPEHVVFLSYHMMDPELDPLTNALALKTSRRCSISRPTVHLIDGVYRAPGAARWRQAEGVYNRTRDAILTRLAEPTEYAIEGDAWIEEGEYGPEVIGSLRVSGPERSSTYVHVVLAEKGVLFPGKSEVVVHRMLARAELLGFGDGLRYEPDEDDEMAVEFDALLEDVAGDNLRYLEELEEQGKGAVPKLSLRIDPRQVRIVALLRDRLTGEVLQAFQIEPELPEDEEDA